MDDVTHDRAMTGSWKPGPAGLAVLAAATATADQPVLGPRRHDIFIHFRHFQHLRCWSGWQGFSDVAPGLLKRA